MIGQILIFPYVFGFFEMFRIFLDLRRKDELVFDIVKSILDGTFVAPAAPEVISSHVPQTPRSPIRPLDDRPKRRRAPVARPSAEESKVDKQQMDIDKENAGENALSSAVAQLKFEQEVSSRPRRATRSRQ